MTWTQNSTSCAWIFTLCITWYMDNLAIIFHLCNDVLAYLCQVCLCWNHICGLLFGWRHWAIRNASLEGLLFFLEPDGRTLSLFLKLCILGRKKSKFHYPCCVHSIFLRRRKDILSLHWLQEQRKWIIMILETIRNFPFLCLHQICKNIITCNKCSSTVTWGSVLWAMVQDKPMIYEQEDVA